MGYLRINLFNISFRTTTELEQSIEVRLRQREQELGGLACQSVQIVGIAQDPDSPDRRVATVLAAFR